MWFALAFRVISDLEKGRNAGISRRGKADDISIEYLLPFFLPSTPKFQKEAESVHQNYVWEKPFQFQVSTHHIHFCFSGLSHGQQQYFRVRPTEVSVGEGGVAVINCAVENRAGRVQWTKDGLTLGKRTKKSNCVAALGK
jgi:hypothetical protein